MCACNSCHRTDIGTTMLVPRTVAQTEWVATTSEQSINKMNKNYSDNVISVYNLIYSMLVHRAQACESVCLSVSVCVCLQCVSAMCINPQFQSNTSFKQNASNGHSCDCFYHIITSLESYRSPNQTSCSMSMRKFTESHSKLQFNRIIHHYSQLRNNTNTDKWTPETRNYRHNMHLIAMHRQTQFKCINSHSFFFS